MAWYAVYVASNGRLRSIGTIVASPLPPGLASVELAQRPTDAEEWDETTRTFIPSVPPVVIDRMDDLRDDPTLPAIWAKLTAAERTTLRTVIIRLLGPRRFRYAGQND